MNVDLFILDSDYVGSCSLQSFRWRQKVGGVRRDIFVSGLKVLSFHEMVLVHITSGLSESISVEVL